ncbi:MAG: 23S rRNA (adenine(2503)-C(2))-methyltransferase RlmN [Deltaproteobacteria bacterium]|nr:23S rRNA (adenine(2503)-C(2))-methyltransferase RlmN [Deltaproteobacteria bacterium]
MIEILDLDRIALSEILASDFSERPFRAEQIMRWLYRRRASGFECMTDISAALRERLREHFSIYRPEISKIVESADGSRKYLLKLADGRFVESVLIKQPTRWTLCVSSQVGCAIDCQFCRTGAMGFVRNLKVHEIVGQVLAVMNDVSPPDSDSFEVRNVVFMGMGEPMHNFENVLGAIKIIGDGAGFDFSGRRVTISTSGVVSGIEKLAASNVKVNLAVSLNATTNEIRGRLMPINRKWPLEVLLRAIREFPLERRQRITVGYVLIKGLNDTPGDLERLAQLLDGLKVKVNLISFNAVPGLEYESSSRECMEHWQQTLMNKGINTTVRWSKGADIDAACGQLATTAKEMQER